MKKKVNILEEQWLSRYAELNVFKLRYGNCIVPQGWEENTPLASWVKLQRRMKRVGKISSKREDLLNQIGFSWKLAPSQKPAKWHERYNQLKAFHKRYGHCDVQYEWKKNPKLGGWVYEQRRRKKALSKEKRKKLNSLNFRWSARHCSLIPWENRYDQLVRFKKRFGHCNVPRNSRQYKYLSNWVRVQRRNKNSMFNYRRKKLEMIGFIWQVRKDKDSLYRITEKLWNKWYKELVKFKRTHGHCIVTEKTSGNLQLAHWVSRQRHFRHKMPENRRKILDKIGFVWRVDTTRPDLKYFKR
jgi:hypothetical protein